MDDVIKSKLAINIAQLSLDKATLEAKLEAVTAENEGLKQQIAELTEQKGE